jgi:hypothetical protein
MQLFFSLVIGTSSICMLFVQRRFVALTGIDHDAVNHLQAPKKEQQQQQLPQLDMDQKDRSSHHQTLFKSSALLKSPRLLQPKGKLSLGFPKLAVLKPSIPFQTVRTIPSRSAHNTTTSTLQPFTNQSSLSSSSLSSLSYWESIQSKSSVDYFTCCGLGHRMSKLVDANYIAQQFNIGLRVHWGFCGGNKNNSNNNSQTTEVFDYLFGPQPAQELETVIETNTRLIIANEAPGFKKIIRDQSVEHCQQKCSIDAATEHAFYYEKLRKRFRRHTAVDAFRNEYFPTTNFTVIAIHVRAGNGEQGDFVKKNRGIEDLTTWTQSVVDTLWRMTQEEWPTSTIHPKKPPLLFVATDTPSIVTEFRKALRGKMPVVEYQQLRAQVGQGVIFGAGPFTTTTTTTKNGQEDGRQACLTDWENAVIDMMLVSHADVIVSGRPSSFTQSLPMSIALARPKSERPVLANYCELGRNGTTSRCYEDFTEWCCEGRSDFHLEGMPTRYEYRRMPVNLEAQKFDFVKRPQHTRPPPNPCTRFGCILPYNWSAVLSEGEDKP